MADQNSTCGCLPVRLQVRVCGLSLQPIGNTFALLRTSQRQLQLPLVALYKCYVVFTSLLTVLLSSFVCLQQ